MSDEESKFSFSERTRVDEGDAPETPPESEENLLEGLHDTAQDEGQADVVSDDRDDASEKTGMLSAVELEEAGILDLSGDDDDGPRAAAQNHLETQGSCCGAAAF